MTESTAAENVRLVPVGDRALLVEFAPEISDAASRAVVTLDVAPGAAMPSGVVEVVPAMTNALVLFDPVVTDHASGRSISASNPAISGAALCNCHWFPNSGSRLARTKSAVWFPNSG